MVGRRTSKGGNTQPDQQRHAHTNKRTNQNDANHAETHTPAHTPRPKPTPNIRCCFSHPNVVLHSGRPTRAQRKAYRTRRTTTHANKQTNKETNNTRKGRHCSAIPTHHAHCGKTQHLSSSNQLLPCLCEWCHLGEGAGRCQIGFWIRLSLIWIGFWMDACRHSDGMGGWMDGCVCVRIHRSL